MLNSYITSAAYSFGSNGSLPFSFSDSSYCLNERYERNPIHTSLSSSCCHCCACAFPTHMVSINPGFLYGLRQSSLLQWPASRKLILGVDRYYHQIPVYGIDRGCYEVSSCSLKKRSIYNTSGGRRNGRCCCMVEKGGSEIYDSRRFDDAEALINLLSEEVDEEHVGGRSRNGISHKRLAIERRGSSRRRERSLSSFEKVQLEKKGKYSSKCNSGKKKTDGLSNSKHEFESVAIESKEEDSKRNEERGALIRSDNQRGSRKEGSSCSSYYSLSSIQDFDSETEVHDKHEQLAEESLTGYKESGWKGEVIDDGSLVEKHKILGDGAEEHVKVSEQRKNAIGGVVEWDWRNKSEKKLTDTLVEDRQSSRESSRMHRRVSGTHESNYGKASSSYKRFSDKEENSALTVNLEEGTRKQYAQKGNQVNKVPTTSRGKFPDHNEKPVFHRGDNETSSQQQERYSSRVENLETTVNLIGEAKEAQHSEVSHLTKKDSFSRNDQHLRRKSGKDLDTERTFISQRQSEIGMIGREENAKIVSNSIQETEEQYQHTGQNIIGQANLRRKSQQSTETLEAYKSNVEKASIIQSETSLNSQVRNTNLVSVTCAESTNPQRIRSRTGSNDATAISVVHGTCTESIPSSQRASEIKIVNQESNTILIGIVGERGEGSKQTNEKLKQISSRKEDKRPTRPSNVYDRDLEEASTFQASLDLVSQDGVQQIGKGDQRSSQAMVMPPSSQLISRSSSQDDSTSGLKAEEVFRTTSEMGSSALHASSTGQPHGEPLNVITPEDALGSADRIQKSSMQFVGEFVEKMRHEVSTSEVQKVRNVADTKLTSEDDKYREKSSSPYGSEDFQQKEHHEARSSGGSGTKGPSDEMWDVTDPSIRKSPTEEEAEATTTAGNVIVRRSGRSFWNIFSDIVRLRWGSHSETPSSAARSGGKISSNESVGSEAWFSSREPEENKDKQAKDKGPQPETASDQMQHQGEESGIIRSMDKVRYLEAETSSSTNIVESASTSEGILLPSGDGTLGFNRYGKSVEGTSSDMEIVGSSLPSAARGVRSTIVSEISSTNNDNESSSGLREQMELPAGGNLDEVLGSEGKDGELKRRKFQRNKQVPKDRFDEWEEAYKLENEQRKIDEMFMREALLEAKKAADTWEVPVGAVLVQHGKIIARGCNLVEELRDSTAHAEMICIREASKLLHTWRLSETTLYVTLEPCPMCAGAILQARVDTLVWGAPNKLLGADGSWIRLFPDGGGNNLELSDKPAAPIHPFHPKMNIRRGILASECADVMQQFFQLRRRKKEKKAEPTPTSSPSVSHHPSKLLGRMHDIFHMMFCL